jgi:hypothetical protein
MIPLPGLLDAAQQLAKLLEPGDLDATLEKITLAAVELIPEVDYASITLRHADGQLETVQATDDCLRELDQRQYELREGPCYDAATDSVHVVSPDLAEDSRFPAYGPAAVEAGIKSQAAFRLYERNGGQAALNLYSRSTGSFTNLESVAVLFQSQAAIAIAYAHEVTTLREALATRTTIGQAVGIVMERFSLNEERAFAFLTRLSQNRNIKLRLIAEEMVTEVSGNAQVASES